MKVALVWQSNDKDDCDRGGPSKKPALAALKPARDRDDEKGNMPGEEHALLIEQGGDELPIDFIAVLHIEGIDKFFEINDLSSCESPSSYPPHALPPSFEAMSQYLGIIKRRLVPQEQVYLAAACRENSSPRALRIVQLGLQHCLISKAATIASLRTERIGEHQRAPDRLIHIVVAILAKAAAE